MPIYSHSRLSTFENCPRHYWYAYIGKPEVPSSESIEAFLGTKVHESLEELYSRFMNGQLWSKDQLLAFFDEDWVKSYSDEIQINNKSLIAEDYRQVGLTSLRAYYDRHQPFDRTRTLRLEGQVDFNLDPQGLYKMRGYIDRLDCRADGIYEIHDYKTSRHIPTQQEADADRQLALYQIAVEKMWSDVRQVDLVWHYLRFDKEIRSRRTSEQLEAVKEQCIGTIRQIDRMGSEEENFPTCESSLCNWCEYRSLCPVHRHAQSLVKASPEEFKRDAGVAMVDALAEMVSKRKSLELEADKLRLAEDDLKEKLIAYAEQYKITAVSGSNKLVDVVESVEIKYPLSDDPRREEFETVIKAAGLMDKVTTINGQLLTSLLKSPDRLSAEQRSAISKFISQTTSKDVRIKAIKDR